MTLPEATTMARFLTSTEKWPWRLVDVKGNTVAQCFRMTGSCAQFKVHEDCHAVKIVDYEGRVRDRFDYRMRKGQLLIYNLMFD